MKRIFCNLVDRIGSPCNVMARRTIKRGKGNRESWPEKVLCYE